MNTDHAHFADWDAAYVLGALSASDRRTFEEHLEGCDACRVALAEIAPTIGLLSRVARDRAESMLVEPAAEGAGIEGGPDASARARLVDLAERRGRRRRAWWLGALTAAAALVVAAVVGVATLIVPSAGPAQIVALEPLVDAPISATVELSGVAWGTSIDMTCTYGESDDDEEHADGWPYALVITAVDGTTSEVSSWRALPGSTARLSAGTSLEPDEIAAVEIQSVGSGKVLMRAEVAGAD